MVVPIPGRPSPENISSNSLRLALAIIDDDATGYLAAFVPAHSVRDHGPAVTACEGSRPAFDRIPANPVTYEI